jgi:hypothetical protein
MKTQFPAIGIALACVDTGDQSFRFSAAQTADILISGYFRSIKGPELKILPLAARLSSDYWRSVGVLKALGTGMLGLW